MNIRGTLTMSDEPNRPLTPEEKVLGELVRLCFPGGIIPPFKPYVAYQESLDDKSSEIRALLPLLDQLPSQVVHLV